MAEGFVRDAAVRLHALCDLLERLLRGQSEVDAASVVRPCGMEREHGAVAGLEERWRTVLRRGRDCLDMSA